VTIRLRMYGKADCHLCDEMKAVVDRLGAQLPIELEVVSIETDLSLWERFWKDIPVLEADGEVLFRHRVTLPALQSALAEKLTMGEGES
jgi:glutaredoxin-like protein DUF836